jgi:hypothetical protein
MSLRRLSSVLGVGVMVASATAVAQPKAAPKADAKAPAPAPAPAPAAPEAPAADAGAPVQMAEEPPPADMDGINENPDTPRTGGGDDSTSVTVSAPAKLTGGYPIEEAARPITLPANMSEVSIDPHVQVSPALATTTLRARYGITRQVQLGVAYVLGGLYDDPGTQTDKTGFHPGKTVGVDVTYLVKNWIGIKLGVPVYVDPVAVGLTIGVPMRFRLNDKLTIGGMDNLVNVAVNGKFAPTLYQEGVNAVASETSEMSNTIQSRGALTFSAYGIYQYRPNFALIGRIGMHLEDFAINRTDGGGGITSSIRGGFQFTPKKFLDLGLSVGFDDLAHGGTFAPAGYLAVRI